MIKLFHESILYLQFLFLLHFYFNYSLPEKPEEEEKPKEKPVFVTKPEPFTTFEGDCARFCCRVTGFPRPRVMWLINGHTVVNVSALFMTSLEIHKNYSFTMGKHNKICIFIIK